jgi:hypothetical protein
VKTAQGSANPGAFVSIEIDLLITHLLYMANGRRRLAAVKRSRSRIHSGSDRGKIFILSDMLHIGVPKSAPESRS